MITPACHSDKIPIRQPRPPWRDGDTKSFIEGDCGFRARMTLEEIS